MTGLSAPAARTASWSCCIPTTVKLGVDAEGPPFSQTSGETSCGSL